MKNNWPAIDHSLLSPSGHMSKAARKAALKREHDRLFPPGYWDAPVKTDAELAAEKAATLRLAASSLRDLASRGMSARKFALKAAELDAQADRLEAAA